MKTNILRQIGFFGIGLALLSSCEESDNVFDQIIADVERGSVLRTVSVQGELPLGQADALFTVEVEVQDQQNGALLQDLDVLIGFNDNTDDVGPGTNVAEQLYTTVPSTQFTTGEFGLPRYTFEIPLGELLTFVGRTNDEITGGDQFTVRFIINTTDGKSFSNNNNSGTLTGSFFRSPFLYTPTIICPIPEGNFTGTYEVTQLTAGIFGRMIRDGAVEGTAVNTTTRSYAVNLYPQFNGGAGFNDNLVIELICDDIIFPTFDTGLQCAPPTITYTQSTITNYDANDDSSFDIIFVENGGGCGGSATVTINFTKQ